MLPGARRLLALACLLHPALGAGDELLLPARPPRAPGGSELARRLEDLDLEQRERVLREEILSGNVPDSWRRFVAVEIERSIEGRTHRATLHVAPDYMAVGSDGDSFLVPLTPGTAQTLADALDCVLPTRRMVDEVYAAAPVRLAPAPIAPGPAMTTVAIFRRHDEMVRRQRAATLAQSPRGTLVAGHKKDVVLTPRLAGAPGRVAIYGWHRPGGDAIQPLYLGHVETYVDYSHGLRLVRRDLTLDGEATTVDAVLADPRLAALLSDEGTVVPARFGPAAVLGPGPAGAFQASPVVAEGARVELLAAGFTFTEGPAADSAGDVYFTDQPTDRILRWSIAGELTTFLQPSGRANGLAFDRAGRLLACADEANELWRIDPETRRATVLVREHGGQRLNGPNDLWIDPAGGVYFTDPFYRRPYWSRGDSEQEGEHVYYLPPGGEALVLAAKGLVRPNGIVGSRDGKRLYVADIGAGQTYRYAVGPGGALSQRRLLIAMGSDGLALDARENLYLTGDGVTVVDTRRGVRIEHVPIDESWTANVCFGGQDGETLFVTAMDSLYALRMKVAGGS